MSERKGTKALELWCKRLIKDCPNVQIDNMTTSWRNGIAFCALVHHFKPDLIDMSSLKPENVYFNNQLAFNIAETQLGIPALLDPEDMVENEVPDRLSILTYLSQFYQRLGNTGTSKSSADIDQKEAAVSPTRNLSPMKLKSGYDKCSVCELPVYLAQRLIASNKLYHRRCFRCAKCDGQLNPNSSFDFLNASEFLCDSCKSEKAISKYLNNNNDCMGMLNYTQKFEIDASQNEVAQINDVKKPKSILEKISMFEKGFQGNEGLSDQLENLSLRYEIKNEDIKQEVANTGADKIDSVNMSDKQYINPYHSESQPSISEVNDKPDETDSDIISNQPIQTPNKLYKSDINKFNFLQTQLLSSDHVEDDLPKLLQTDNTNLHTDKDEPKITFNDSITNIKCPPDEQSENLNVTDDVRLSINTETNIKYVTNEETNDCSSEKTLDKSISQTNRETKKGIPPRRKKQNANEKASRGVEDTQNKGLTNKTYPDHLNPFSDDEDEVEQVKQKQVSTNPFGSSDEEEIDKEPASVHALNSSNKVQSSTPIKRVIPAPNPFWSDGEEPSSGDESTSMQSASMYSKSAITTSTPNFPSAKPRKKSRAPPPPAVTLLKPVEGDGLSHSMEDVASLSSVSSYCSTVNSDHKTSGKLTPKSRKKRPAPTPPDSISYLSTGSRDLNKSNTDLADKSFDATSRTNNSEGCTRKAKGPAPGLPLPERRAVRPQVTAEALQTQLDLLDAQQLGLERQGVLIEQMIRDRCEGDEAATVSQEEVEDLVIQLCELVNEKNDLFRKQTELMYIRRQQRLEQEQADIEHEIRIIQSRPAVNRIDADKAREEHLVSRLVEIVRLRDELVQQLDAERRREIQEDLAIATSIAERRAQRNSDSNTSSMTSVDVGRTTKKTKVKDKVKKQLKKAKHSLNIKKKDDQDVSVKEKEKNTDKDHKTKWF